MYKVFFNQKSIVITHPQNITLFKTLPVYADTFSKDDIKTWFEGFAEGEIVEAVLVHSLPESFFQLFQSAFKIIYAAGGVVFREKKILFIFRNEKWDLPKGKIDAGETIEETALREVEEECGIKNMEIRKNLPSTFHIYKSPYKKSLGEWIFKETFWFEMNYNGRDSGVPQLEEGITEIRWLATNELDLVMKNTYENLKQIVAFYLD